MLATKTKTRALLVAGTAMFLGLGVSYAASLEISTSVAGTVTINIVHTGVGPEETPVATSPPPAVILATIPLNSGFNLVALPVGCATPMSAQALADLIEAQGGVVDSVQRWGVGGSQAFDGWLPGAPNPFLINSGHAYFIKVSSAPANNEISVNGVECTLSVPLDFLVVGFNLLSVPFASPPNGYNASSLAAVIEAGGAVVDSVQRWGVGGSQGFDGWLPGGASPFAIDSKAGYFLKLSKVPASPVVP